jgi:hypothetical protein
MFFGGYVSTVLRKILSLPLGRKPSTMEREKQVPPNRWCPSTKPDDVKSSSRALLGPLQLYLVRMKENKIMWWLRTQSRVVVSFIPTHAHFYKL